MIDLKPIQSTISQKKEGEGRGETLDSEVAGKDFKLVESELNEEMADEMDDGVVIAQGEIAISKSPIRVKTLAVNKVENSRTHVNAAGDEIGNRSLAPADSSMTDLSINVIGLAAYPAQA